MFALALVLLLSRVPSSPPPPRQFHVAVLALVVPSIGPYPVYPPRTLIFGKSMLGLEADAAVNGCCIVGPKVEAHIIRTGSSRSEHADRAGIALTHTRSATN